MGFRYEVGFDCATCSIYTVFDAYARVRRLQGKRGASKPTYHYIKIDKALQANAANAYTFRAQKWVRADLCVSSQIFSEPHLQHETLALRDIFAPTVS